MSSIEKENRAGYCPTHSHLLPSIYPPKRSEASGVDSRCPSRPPSLHRTKCLLLSRGVQNARMPRPSASVQGVAGVNGSLCSRTVDPLGIPRAPPCNVRFSTLVWPHRVQCGKECQDCHSHYLVCLPVIGFMIICLLLSLRNICRRENGSPVYRVCSLLGDQHNG